MFLILYTDAYIERMSQCSEGMCFISSGVLLLTGEAMRCSSQGSPFNIMNQMLPVRGVYYTCIIHGWKVSSCTCAPAPASLHDCITMFTPGREREECSLAFSATPAPPHTHIHTNHPHSPVALVSPWGARRPTCLSGVDLPERICPQLLCLSAVIHWFRPRQSRSSLSSDIASGCQVCSAQAERASDPEGCSWCMRNVV